MKKTFFSEIISFFFFLFLSQFSTAQVKNVQHVPGSSCHNCPSSQINDQKNSNPLPQNGNGSVATTYTVTACGINYVLGSVVIEQRTNGVVASPPPGLVQPAAISIAGIPPCATITKAFLYADASGNGVAVTATVQNPGGGSANFPMTIIGQDQDKCWASVGYTATYSYRADVTSIITGNGNYSVSGLPVSPAPGPNDIDGCTLVIVYTDPSAAYTGSMVIADGSHVSIGANISDNISGFTACGNSTSGSNFICVGDLQGLNTTTISGSYNFTYPTTSNAWWDCIVNPITVTTGQNSASFNFANGSDCFNIVAIGMYFQTTCNNCSSPTMTVTASNTSSCNTTSATATVTGGTAPYTYVWTGTAATTPSVNPIAAGIQTVTVTDATGCIIATDTVFIPTTSGPPMLVNSDSICPGGSTVLTATGATTYLWSPATGLSTTSGGSVTANPAVTTIYTITGTIGTCTGTITSTVTVNTPPVLTTPNITACAGVIIPASNWVSVPAGATYTWTNSNAAIGLAASGTGNTNSFAGLNAGTTPATAVVNITPTLLGCVGPTTSYTITVNPYPPLPATTNIEYCLNAVANALTATPAFGGTLNWYGTNAVGGIASPTAPTPLTNGISTTTYYVSQTVGGCEGPRAPIVVLVDPLPVATLSPKISGCSVLCGTFVTTSVPPGINYVWNMGTGTVSGNDTVTNYCYAAAGIYNLSVTVTDTNNCTATTAFPNWVTVYSIPFADFSWSPDPIGILDPLVHFTDLSTGNNITTYQWNFGDTLAGGSTSTFQNPVFLYPYVGSYSAELIVADTNGCADTVVKQIIVLEDFTVYVPNAITPNGDGKNDLFYPLGIGIDPENYELLIFDRWGNQIFQTTDMASGWDGKVQGKTDKVEIDVYVWKIRCRSIVNGDKKNLVGHVTVVR